MTRRSILIPSTAVLVALCCLPACKDQSKSAAPKSDVASVDGSRASEKKSAVKTPKSNPSEDFRGGLKQDSKSPKDSGRPAAQPRSIEELKKLKKPIPTTKKQKELRERSKRGMNKAEGDLERALKGESNAPPKKPGAAPDAEKQAGGGGADGKVAPSGTFPEAAHNLYESLCQQIEGVDRVIAEFRKSKSKKIWMKAKMSVTECMVTAREIAEEYEGYPGIDDRIADLEKKEQALIAEKP